VDPTNSDNPLASIVAGGFTHEALAALDKIYPERSAGIKDTMETLMFRGGQRSVIRFLHSLKEHGN
jgi:hypothetical protein